MTTLNEILAHLKKTASGPLSDACGATPAFYWNEEVAAAEEASIFRRDWVCPGLAAEIPDKGDYITFSIAGEPVFSIRDMAGEIKTYSNICRHRMMQLLKGRGRTSRVICPYHAWTYDLNGQLIGASHMDQSEGFDKNMVCLPEIRTEIWNGWIYITLNPHAQSIREALSALHEVVARYEMENYVPVLQEEHVWRTNWKLLTENFMEGYHLPIAHKATVGAWFRLDKTVFPADTHEAFTYQTFVKTGKAIYGQAHPDNIKLLGEWRYTSILPTVFPTHMFVLAPDHLWYLSLRSRGVGEVDVRFGVAIAPEVEAMLKESGEKAAWIKDLVKFFEHVNGEDREVVEGIYAGSHSSFAVPGQLSWLEREIHDFQKYLAQRLVPETHRTD
ncbi:MAG: SRPBCC family protein [Paracoccaceae bacterium]|nr:SRPBCC family protein [Paracoccaceae bacterium]